MRSCPCPYLPASLFACPSACQPVWILDLLFYCDLIHREPQELVQLLDLLSCRAELCLPAIGGPASPSLHLHLSIKLANPPSPFTVCTYWIPLFTTHSDKGICQADEQSELKRCVMHAWKDLTSCRGREDAGVGGAGQVWGSSGGGGGPQAGLYRRGLQSPTQMLLASKFATWMKGRF